MKSQGGQQLRWYAIRTRARHEKVASGLLRNKGFEVLLPQYKTRKQWTDRVKEVELPLFSGYVFCRFDARFRTPILETIGVVDVVRAGKNVAPVDDEEIEALKKAMDAGLSCIPWTAPEKGQHVRIGIGALAGVSGTVIEVKKSLRLVLSISLLNRHVLVEVDPHSLAAFERPFTVPAPWPALVGQPVTL